MATHELSYYDISGSVCSGSIFAYYPGQVEWSPEHLGYDIHSRPVFGDFYEVHWRISAMPYENRIYGSDIQGGWEQLDTFFQSGSPLCLKTVPKGSLTPATYHEVYMLKPTGTQSDVNAYDIEITFVRVQP